MLWEFVIPCPTLQGPSLHHLSIPRSAQGKRWQFFHLQFPRPRPMQKETNPRQNYTSHDIPGLIESHFPLETKNIPSGSLGRCEVFNLLASMRQHDMLTLLFIISYAGQVWIPCTSRCILIYFTVQPEPFPFFISLIFSANNWSLSLDDINGFASEKYHASYQFHIP